MGVSTNTQGARTDTRMQPRYVTLSSQGSSPWSLVNWHTTPINIGFGVRTSALSSTWQIDVTMDDPTGVFPSSAGPTIFQSSQVGTIAGGSSNAVGAILQPIAAWRLTNNSTGGVATVTVLQAGIG
jgi:hypothetical protein